jgi:copper chaperone CopZ
MSCYCHITPGRLRVKTPIIRQNAAEAEKVRAMLQSVPGVRTVSVNAMTGSITVLHCGSAVDSESILSLLKKDGYFTVSEERDHHMESLVSRVGATIGKVILGAVVEKAFEGSMLSFLAFLV